MKQTCLSRIVRIVTVVFFSALLSVDGLHAQTQPATATNMTRTNRPARRGPAPEVGPQAPEMLPGDGLAQHDFMYAGEATPLRITVFRQGKVAWSYTHPGRGEISDATLLSNGTVLFAHQFGVTEVNADKQVIWNYDCPTNFEVHTAQAIGKDHVLFVQNGNPAKLFVVNIVSGKTEKEFELPVGNPRQTHTQFREARLTDAGTVLIGHMDMGKVCEYDSNGKELMSVTVRGAWGIQPLKNGHILVASNNNFVREVTREGETVWEYRPTDTPDYKIANMQTATRLSNGNTLFNNWRSKGNGTAVQALEITSDKKVVWALRSWTDPDLGASTIVQLLDEPGAPEDKHFGDIK